ncbi:hypothetical protein PIB30_092469 [Stylosanthes scabra]|uniref:Putative plant transposon protein domain-containing protein n=1 Tax=Stylosanthes scabra TaxID=79078 RepID=A0ABU6YTP9_9FABA|nr:hypothetical protein [Stylosanthes scabra]
MASSSSTGANVLDAHCFRTLFNQYLYEETAQKKKVIPEVGFNLNADQYPEIKDQITKRGWRRLASPRQEIAKAIIQEFCANAARTEEEIEGLDENPTSLTQGYDQQLDQVLTDLCIPGATWKMGNKSEVTTARAVLIHSIIKGDDIIVENLIADSIILITQGVGRKGKLGFPSTIYKLCKDAKHQPRNENEDHDMPEYEPENEADFDNLQHEQERHQFQQPPQQQYHHQQPPYEDYPQFQQTMMEPQQQGFNSMNEMLVGMQLQQQNMFQGLQTTQNQYLEELRALKTRQNEFFSIQNNQYNMIRQEQDLMAKEIQDLKKYQVNTTMMGANRNEIDQLVNKVGEQQHLYTEVMKQLKEWTRNSSARECYYVWTHQQANPNLVEMPV